MPVWAWLLTGLLAWTVIAVVVALGTGPRLARMRREQTRKPGGADRHIGSPT